MRTKPSVDERAIREFIESPAAWALMKPAADQGKPVAPALDREMRALGVGRGDDALKKQIGKWIRDVMIAHGYEPTVSARAPRGNVFATAMCYEKT